MVSWYERRTVVGLGLVCAAVLVSGCEESTTLSPDASDGTMGSAPDDMAGDPGAPGASGVPSGTPLGSLTDDEARLVCEWIMDTPVSTGLSKRDNCELAASGSAENPEECSMLVEICLEPSPLDPPDGEADGGSDEEGLGCEDASASDIPADCNATVADYERCWNDTVAQNAAWLAELEAVSCADVGVPSEDPGAAGPPDFLPDLPESCQSLDAQCPGLFDADEVECPDGSGFIAEDWFCDGTSDCDDGSDEQGC